MRWFAALALILPLAAQSPFLIVSVDRIGSPPYEPESRVYRLNGGTNRSLKVGEWLTVRRPGRERPLGHLRVLTVGTEEAGTAFVPLGDTWPMKGDLVWRDPLPGVPAVTKTDDFPSALPPPPIAGAVAPPREGLIYFLPKRADLSPAGRVKVVGWVQGWGVAGRWVIQMPTGKAFQPALQKQRAEALLATLRECGVPTAEIQSLARIQEGPHDPSWILHWD